MKTLGLILDSIAIPVSLSGVSGCTLANYHSISRKFDTNDGKSRFVDAQQRSILVWQEPEMRGCGVDGQPCPASNVESKFPRPIICAEPSPDALVAYAATLAAEGSYSGASAELNLSTIGAATAIGRRTQSIQLLRDAYYRACEAYISQAIDRETYDSLIRRLNNQSIAYLAIEQITAVASSTPPASVTPPDLKPLYAKLDAAKKTLDQAIADKKKADEALKQNTDATKADTLKAAATQAETAVKSADTGVAAASLAIVEAAKPTASAPADGQAGSNARAADAVEKITMAVINADYAAQMCFAHFRSRETKDPTTTLEKYCDRVLNEHAKGLENLTLRAKAQFETEQSIKKAIDECTTAAHADPAKLAKCISSIPPSTWPGSRLEDPTGTVVQSVGGMPRMLAP